MSSEIKKDEVISLLLKACPSYQKRWEEHVHSNYEEGEEQLLYIDLANFANHLIELYKANKLDEFVKIFETIELLHTNGDEYVKEAATIGLLEDIQNYALSNNISLDIFVKYLEPESRNWWTNLNDFWNGKTDVGSGKKK